jgi:hypothetical protein
MLTTRACLWLALLAVPALLPEAAAAPAVEAFGSIPQTDDVTLSPDGKLIAWKTSTGGTIGVIVLDVDTRKVKRTQRIENTMKLRAVSWADNETLLLNVSITDPKARNEDERYEFWRILSLKVATGATKFLLMGGGERASVTGAQVLSVYGSKPKNHHHVLV